MSQSSNLIPHFSASEAQSLAADLFGVSATARPLPSEQDQNFLLEPSSGPQFVLKIANAGQDTAILDAQNAALTHLASQAPEFHCPRIHPATTGELIARAQGSDGSTHFVRMLTYVPGHLFVHTSPHTSELLDSLGQCFGQLDRALSPFSHPALKRVLQWDLKHASEVIEQNIDHIAESGQRNLVTHFLQRFRKVVLPALPKLRTSVIHNDGNDYNVLVSDLYPSGGTVTGVIDFGDLVETHTVFELAICSAYALLGKADPIAAVAQVVGGYHLSNPLTELELELLYDLIATRLCTSVVIAAREKKAHPENSYLTVSEAPASTALHQLASLSPRFTHYAFRHACGLAPCERDVPIVEWLRTHAQAMGPVVEHDVQNAASFVFDLCPGSFDFTEVADLSNTKRWAEVLFERMESAGVQVGIGRYNEPRRTYTSTSYRPDAGEIEDCRTIHLGMDLFLEPGTRVLTPLDSVVHSFANNTQPQDYGPTIILRHHTDAGLEFFTLYGHLSVESLESLSPGKHMAKGTCLGTIGTSAINGGWPPHLHFQLITDVFEYSGNFPGVCTARDRDLWLALCPDPNLILRIPNLPKPDHGRSLEDILTARQQHIGKSLSLSYHKPLKIVQGWMQYLYDHLGREYLDTVNNVNHVGHSHPTVVQAAQRQMAVLNTNTRFLHDNLVDYAERLCALFPSPLNVCFFVCSGSEANELALRLARAHTRATDFIVVEGGYHGNTSTLVDISPYKFDGPGGAGAPPNVHTVMMPDPYRGPHRDKQTAGHLYAQQVHEVVNLIQSNGNRVCAFICESMLSCGGQIILPPEYLAEAYHHVRAAGGVCIADEVQVGFGRLGSHFWGFQTQGVVPDIVTLGKPMGNGHPLAAVVTRPEIAESFANGMEYFNTFGGNPVSCAIGMAVLNIIETEHLQEHALHTGQYFKEQLSQLMKHHALIGDVRGEGLFLGVELVRDGDTLETAGVEASYVSNRMKDLGVLVSTDGPFHNVLKIKPPMVFTQADADRFISVLDQVLGEPRLKLIGTSS